MAFWPALIGVIIGVVALVRIWTIKAGSKQVRSHGIAISGVVIGAVMLVLSVYGSIHTSWAVSNSMRISKAMAFYPDDSNGSYPDPNHWCDMLLETGAVKLEYFLNPRFDINYLMFQFSWPQPKKGRCHFAMNDNCTIDSSPDTVLLFDAALGWNKHGGPELLVLDRYQIPGCYIMFKDGHVEFVKEPWNLNWGVTSNMGLNPERLAPAD